MSTNACPAESVFRSSSMEAYGSLSGHAQKVLFLIYVPLMTKVASDPKPGTPKKVKVYEIIQEKKKEKNKRKETNKGKKKPKRSQRKRLSQGRVMRMTYKHDKIQE